VSLFRDVDRARRLGLVLAAASGLTAVIGLALLITAGARFFDPWVLQNAFTSLAWGVSSAAMVNQQPNNAAAWTVGCSLGFAAFGQVLAVGVAGAAVGRTVSTAAVRGEVASPHGALPNWLAWTIASREMTWVLVVVPAVTPALLRLLADGRVAARRGRAVAGVALVGLASVCARASSVHARLEQRDDVLWSEIADDGLGFDPDHTGHGCRRTGISARLEPIDGTPQIRSRPGTGTGILGRIPELVRHASAPRVATEVPV
jgi:hypothetical protein